jgi:hypothetical protein
MTTMQLRLFVINVPVGMMILSLILFSHIFTETVALAATGAKDKTDGEVEDKNSKQESGTTETKSNDDDSAKDGKEDNDDEEQQESSDDTRAIQGGLEDSIMIEDKDEIYSSDDNDNDDDDKDVPFELPFDDIPFP